MCVCVCTFLYTGPNAEALVIIVVHCVAVYIVLKFRVRKLFCALVHMRLSLCLYEGRITTWDH